MKANRDFELTRRLMMIGFSCGKIEDAFDLFRQISELLQLVRQHDPH